MCIYVCRSETTPKSGFQYVNLIQKEKHFKHFGIVINAVDMSKRKNSHGYGYGYGYGDEPSDKSRRKKNRNKA